MTEQHTLPTEQQTESTQHTRPRLASPTQPRGALFHAEATLRAMRAYGGVVLFSSTFQPIMYVLAMGPGLGSW